MARLWWIGRLTVDKDAEDPYRLTKFVCEHSDYIMHALERNTSNNPMIIRAFFSACMDARDKEGLVINTDVVGELQKYLNLLGGTYILDCLPEKTIYEKILLKAREIDARRREEQKAKKINKDRTSDEITEQVKPTAKPGGKKSRKKQINKMKKKN